MTVSDIDGDRDEALRADIRRLGSQLGDALTRQHGTGLLDMVEEVRSLTKRIRNDDDARAGADLDKLLSAVDLDGTIQLVRAFTSAPFARSSSTAETFWFSTASISVVVTVSVVSRISCERS